MIAFFCEYVGIIASATLFDYTSSIVADPNKKAFASLPNSRLNFNVSYPVRKLYFDKCRLWKVAKTLEALEDFLGSFFLAGNPLLKRLYHSALVSRPVSGLDHAYTANIFIADQNIALLLIVPSNLIGGFWLWLWRRRFFLRLCRCPKNSLKETLIRPFIINGAGGGIAGRKLTEGHEFFIVSLPGSC